MVRAISSETQHLRRLSVFDLVRFAVELGAQDVGGPLSASEMGLVRETYEVPKPTKEELAIVRSLLQAGEDPLGQAFSLALSPEERRPLGAVYTPRDIVDPMVEWVMARRPSRVVDAGAGSGRYSLAVAQRDPGVRVVAVDSDPIATMVCRANCAVLGYTNVEVVQGDYTALELPVIQGRTAFIGNPPYVRHHELTTQTKAWAQWAGNRLGVPVSGLAGLHVLFVLATALLARKGDVGCLVTSAEWLDVGYGNTLRHLLSGWLGVQSMHRLAPEAIPFEDAMTTALITCFEVGSAEDRIGISQAATVEELRNLDDGDRIISRERAASVMRWSPLFSAGGTTEAPAVHIATEEMVPLGSLVRVSRGVATGANGYFVMSAAEAELRGLSQFACPVITGAQEIFDSPGVIRSAGLKVIINLPKDLDLTAPDMEAVREYLAFGIQMKIQEKYLCAHRKPWWSLGIKAAPPIVATYMARQAPMFALNPDGTALLNVAHGLYPKVALTDAELGALVGFLNRHRDNFRGEGRTYHGGLEKFEPKEMEALMIPSLARLRMV